MIMIMIMIFFFFFFFWYELLKGMHNCTIYMMNNINMNNA